MRLYPLGKGYKLHSDHGEFKYEPVCFCLAPAAVPQGLRQNINMRKNYAKAAFSFRNFKSFDELFGSDFWDIQHITRQSTQLNCVSVSLIHCRCKVKIFEDDYLIQVRETGKFALTMFRNCSLCKYLEFYDVSV